MVSTNLDGSNMMALNEGNTVALVIGDKVYRGTLRMRKNGTQEDWFIKLTGTELGEPDEVQIHKL